MHNIDLPYTSKLDGCCFGFDSKFCVFVTILIFVVFFLRCFATGNDMLTNNCTNLRISNMQTVNIHSCCISCTYHSHLDISWFCHWVNNDQKKNIQDATNCSFSLLFFCWQWKHAVFFIDFCELCILLIGIIFFRHRHFFLLSLPICFLFVRHLLNEYHEFIESKLVMECQINVSWPKRMSLLYLLVMKKMLPSAVNGINFTRFFFSSFFTFFTSFVLLFARTVLRLSRSISNFEKG